MTVTSAYSASSFAFQLTRSRGAWPYFFICGKIGMKFQLTRSRGAWLIDFKLYNISLVFQLTRSRGAWPQSRMIWADVWAFQLTRSRGAWRLSILAWQVSANFNSHAHVERDKDNVILTSDKQISTHTLTWSVTKTYGQVRACISISTHTLTWSVTARLMHHLK